MRGILLVLDSVGIGAAPDAGAYGDAGANTLGHTAESVGGLNAPVLQSLGLGNIPALLPGGMPIRGVPPAPAPRASYGAMRERSQGKDTTTGHWEMAGLLLDEGFRVFPAAAPSFPPQIIEPFARLTRRGVLGNRAASGTQIIAELGERHLRTGEWIVYTSADSVLQIAAHERIVPLPELYQACRHARDLCNPFRVGRVIARPFIGEPGRFVRTTNRRDFSYPLPEPSLLDRLYAAGVQVTTVGKLDDIFDHRGIHDARHVETSAAAQEALRAILASPGDGLVFANFIDFDMLYGHRRDAPGYARCLEQTDTFLGDLVSLIRDGDLLVITADHGNDPTAHGTDHTREFVPLLAFRPGGKGRSLGIRDGFFDAGQTFAEFFGIAPLPRGTSFLSRPKP